MRVTRMYAASQQGSRRSGCVISETGSAALRQAPGPPRRGRFLLKALPPEELVSRGTLGRRVRASLCLPLELASRRRLRTLYMSVCRLAWYMFLVVCDEMR